MKKNPKVLYVIDTLEESGAERSLLEITSKFSQIDPVFVHLYKGDSLKNEFIQKGIPTYSLNLSGSWNFKEAEQKLAEIYRKEQPDIIHSTLFRSDLVTRRLKKVFPEVPLISSFVNNSYHPMRFKQSGLGLRIKLKFIQKIDTVSSKKVDYFISNSNTIKQAKAKATNVPLDKIKVIPRGRDLSRFNGDISNGGTTSLRKELKAENKKILLNVSRLIERKGQKDLIYAMPGILKAHPNTVLFIVGEGPFRTELESTIQKLNLENNVFLLGRREDVPELISIADVFVFPSYFEGLPGALIEAMMGNLLISCSNIPENMECVNDKSAVIFKVGDISDISDKINYAVTNESSLKHLREYARKTAENEFDIFRIAQKYEDFYFSINR
ncbi:glycosyltransferase [Salinimicrobium gaetbulicola]|uniref:Glycosyltransferase n=1 Tax=Salinimicrobium gaetbulicola TaxID=999702 RepID=A0ABW3ICD4_9FLAO